MFAMCAARPLTPWIPQYRASGASQGAPQHAKPAGRRAMRTHVLFFVEYPRRTRLLYTLRHFRNCANEEVRRLVGRLPNCNSSVCRNDAQLLDVEYLGQLKVHHQFSLPVVLDEQETMLIMALPLNPRPLCSTTCPSLPPPPSWVL